MGRPVLLAMPREPAALDSTPVKNWFEMWLEIFTAPLRSARGSSEYKVVRRSLMFIALLVFLDLPVKGQTYSSCLRSMPTTR